MHGRMHGMRRGVGGGLIGRGFRKEVFLSKHNKQNPKSLGVIQHFVTMNTQYSYSRMYSNPDPLSESNLLLMSRFTEYIPQGDESDTSSVSGSSLASDDPILNRHAKESSIKTLFCLRRYRKSHSLPVFRQPGESWHFRKATVCVLIVLFVSNLAIVSVYRMLRIYYI